MVRDLDGACLHQKLAVLDHKLAVLEGVNASGQQPRNCEGEVDCDILGAPYRCASACVVVFWYMMVSLLT